MTGLRRALWALAGAGLLLLAVQIDLIATSDFAPDRGLWIALDVVIGGGFVGVGLYAWSRRPDNRVGVLMVATGFAWFVGVFNLTDPALLFTLGLATANLFMAPAIHLLLAFPSGRLETRFDRRLVIGSYIAVTVGFLVPMFFLGSGDKHCTTCPDNLLLVEPSSGFVGAWFDGLCVIGIAALLAVLGRLIARWRRAAPPLRRIVTPLFVSGAVLMALLATLLFFDLAGIEVIESAYYVALIPFALVPYLFLAGLARARMLRAGAVGELVARVGGAIAGRELRDELARALNDPSLELAFWIPDSGAYVDPEGRSLELPESGRRATSDVTLDGRRVAVLIHDPLLLEEPELVEAVGAAAALALEKDRLEAELRAKIGELRESRARMVSFGLAERRRLERDLHDGAQQRLVSLALDLRLARDAARTDPERSEELLDGAAEELERALGELRELARGIHPAVLSDRGLDPAVEAIANRAPLAVEVVGRLGERVPEPVELAAYFVVSEALTNVAKYAHAAQATVRVERENGRVVVEVADDGVGGADPQRGTGLRGLADRIAALGGRLDVDSRPEGGTMVRARIPCE
ncbi:MAG: histidine kinase [Solirubrobacterales bacterium]|nr:histidine kinase [Solirubrobacterales bacterium]